MSTYSYRDLVRGGLCLCACLWLFRLANFDWLSLFTVTLLNRVHFPPDARRQSHTLTVGLAIDCKIGLTQSFLLHIMSKYQIWEQIWTPHQKLHRAWCLILLYNLKKYLTIFGVFAVVGYFGPKN